MEVERDRYTLAAQALATALDALDALQKEGG